MNDDIEVMLLKWQKEDGIKLGPIFINCKNMNKSLILQVCPNIVVCNPKQKMDLFLSICKVYEW